MIALLCFLLTLLVSPFKSKSRLEAENVALRRPLIVLRRKVRSRVHLTNGDRLFFVQPYRCSGMPICPLASGRLPSVVALEIWLSWRPAKDRRGSARVDLADDRKHRIG